jgi:hypothetical protein
MGVFYLVGPAVCLLGGIVIGMFIARSQPTEDDYGMPVTPSRCREHIHVYLQLLESSAYAEGLQRGREKPSILPAKSQG